MTTFRDHEVREETIAVGSRTFHLWVPRTPEALLERPHVQARFAQDEYMPYWTTLWPAARLLATELARSEVFTAGAPVLDLGAGLGLTTLVLLARGCRVTAADHDADALALLCENARRNNLPLPTTLPLDWHTERPATRFARIVAADVLYERRQLPAIAAFLSDVLAPGGSAWLCDPNRQVADAFPEVALGGALRTTQHTLCALEGAHAGRLFVVQR